MRGWLITDLRTIKQRLSQVLAQRQKWHIGDDSRVPSAVLIPVYYKQGQWYVLLTKRTEKVKDHKGQISFPGGVYEQEDGTLVNTALRECAEEIGVIADKVEVLGELDDTTTLTSSYIISPFVGIIPWPHQFKANQEEIEEILEMPISALLDKSCWREERTIIDGRAVTSYFYHYQGEVIWGATARILDQFLDIFVHVLRDSW